MKTELTTQKPDHIKEFRMKLTEAGVDHNKRIDLLEWFSKVILDYYQKGSDDAARIYKDAYNK